MRCQRIKGASLGGVSSTRLSHVMVAFIWLTGTAGKAGGRWGARLGCMHQARGQRASAALATDWHPGPSKGGCACRAGGRTRALHPVDQLGGGHKPHALLALRVLDEAGGRLGVVLQDGSERRNKERSLMEELPPLQSG